MEHIRHYLVIKAPVGKVYKAITSQDGLSKWWTEKTIAKPEFGFLNEFRFGEQYHNKMRVTELIPNNSVNWICEVGDQEWIDTKISFNLEAKEGKTILRFAQRDWSEATEFYESCNFHWGYFMQSLKMLCETGKGTPHQDSNKKHQASS